MATTEKPTVGEQLWADGVRVDLGGEMIKLRADLPAMIVLEKRWGSLSAWVDELTKGLQGKFYTAVGDGIAACVRHLPVDPMELMEITPDAIQAYAEALLAAFRQAGLITDEEDVQGNAPGPTPNGPSPGSASSTSASSAAVSVRKRSGR